MALWSTNMTPSQDLTNFKSVAHGYTKASSDGKTNVTSVEAQRLLTMFNQLEATDKREAKRWLSSEGSSFIGVVNQLP